MKGAMRTVFYCVITTVFIISVHAVVWAQHDTSDQAVTSDNENGSLHDQNEKQGEAAEILDPVVVTAERIEEYIKNNPQNVHIINRKDIENGKYLDLSEAVDSMPGVDVKPSSGMGSRISIRGYSGAGNIIVLVNGRPMSQSQYGGVELGSLPIDLIKSITVFKPPIPVWLGMGGTGGAIAIETDHFKQEDAAGEKKSTWRIRAGAGSFGAVKGDASVSTPFGDNNLMISGGVERLDGKRTNSDRESGRLSVNWDGKTKGFTQYHVDGKFYTSEHGSPGPTDNPTPDARQTYSKGALDLRAEGFAGEVAEYTIKTYLDIVRLEDESQTGFTSDLDTLKLGLKGDVTWTDEKGSRSLRVGGLAELDTVDHTVSGDHDRESTAIFAQYDHGFQSMTVTFGLRGEHTNDFGFHPAVSTGIGVPLSENTLLKANAGYSVKIPTFAQLYQPSHGSYDQVRGNPNLTEETVMSYDLGVERTFSNKANLELTLFRSDHDDFIAYDKGEDLIHRPVNLDAAYRQGLEMTLKYPVIKSFEVNLNYIYQDSEEDSHDGELTYAPRQKLKTAFIYKSERTGTRLEAIIQAVDEQYGDLANRNKLSGYANMDLKLNQPITVRGKKTEAYVHINNVLDHDFDVHDGYPDDGFRFTIGINITL